MKIITYNTNGLRTPLSKGLPEWLAQEQPDVLCIHKIKLQPDQFPQAETFETLGYKSYLFSAQKKGYSGVAILTKQEPDHIEYGMGIEKYDNEGRFLRADFGDVSIVSVYHPSGKTSGDERQDFKMIWLEDFQKYVVELRTNPVSNSTLCGDYNICHKPIYIHDPIRKCKEQRLPSGRTGMDDSLLIRRFYGYISLLEPGQARIYMVELSL